MVSIDTTAVTPLGDDVYRVWERSVSRTSSDDRVGAVHNHLKELADQKINVTAADAVTAPLPRRRGAADLGGASTSSGTSGPSGGLRIWWRHGTLVMGFLLFLGLRIHD